MAEEIEEEQQEPIIVTPQGVPESAFFLVFGCMFAMILLCIWVQTRKPDDKQPSTCAPNAEVQKAQLEFQKAQLKLSEQQQRRA